MKTIASFVSFSALALTALGLFVTQVANCCEAAVLGFESFAPSGGLTNVSPVAPYLEAGFELKPTSSLSAVFDSLDTGAHMIGNDTDWFGFQEGNVPSLTLTIASGQFNIGSLLIGPSRLRRTPRSIW